jgi:dTDP-4-amino-4,6-dideoxygalactose transaminase
MSYPNKIRVPFVNLGLQYEYYRDRIVARLDALGKEGQYIGGNEVERFEAGLAEICGVSHCIAVANGTDALVLVLKALGIGPDDEVITAPNSFIASAGAIAAVGATPVFVDVSADYNLDPLLLEQAISNKTKAIIPVHLTGNPAAMDEINVIAAKYALAVVEDAAQAIGAKYKERPVGSLGHAAAFSLHPLKNLHLMGDAGFITTNDNAIAKQLKQLRNHGLVNRDICEFWGFNSRLDAFQAAVGNIKLADFNEITAAFQTLAKQYYLGLNEVVTCPLIPAHNEAVFHNFVIQVDRRQELMDFLLREGIETKIHYPVPLHLMPAAKDLGYKLGDFPKTEAMSQRILSLPIYPELREEQVELVVEKIKQFVKESA